MIILLFMNPLNFKFLQLCQRFLKIKKSFENKKNVKNVKNVTKIFKKRKNVSLAYIYV